jgi:hypothetical protein
VPVELPEPELEVHRVREGREGGRSEVPDPRPIQRAGRRARSRRLPLVRRGAEGRLVPENGPRWGFRRRSKRLVPGPEGVRRVHAARDRPGGARTRRATAASSARRPRAAVPTVRRVGGP